MDHTYSFTCTAMNEKNISLGVGPPLMERSYWSISNGGVLMAHTECEGWLSPGGHSLGGRALTAQVIGPQFNPGWLPVFHGTHVHTQTWKCSSWKHLPRSKELIKFFTQNISMNIIIHPQAGNSNNRSHPGLSLPASYWSSGQDVTYMYVRSWGNESSSSHGKPVDGVGCLSNDQRRSEAVLCLTTHSSLPNS